LSKILLK